jgi:hypothetical protein
MAARAADVPFALARVGVGSHRLGSARGIMCHVGERAERKFGVPMALVADGWRPRACLRHQQPATTRKSLLVDNMFDSVFTVQVRSRRIAEWPLCVACLKAQRRAQVFGALAFFVALGYMLFWFFQAPVESTVGQFALGFAFCAMASLAVVLGRRALMPALSAGLRLSRDCRTLVIKARHSSTLIQAELDEVKASRWY